MFKHQRSAVITGGPRCLTRTEPQRKADRQGDHADFWVIDCGAGGRGVTYTIGCGRTCTDLRSTERGGDQPLLLGTRVAFFGLSVLPERLCDFTIHVWRKGEVLALVVR